MENDVQKKFYDKTFEKAHVWRDSDFSEDNKFFINRFLNRAFRNKAQKILEIGCGNGLLTFFLLKRPVKITAVDVSDRAIENMKEQFKEEISQSKLKPVAKDILSFLEKTEEQFDLIIGSGIIHHIDKKDWEKLYGLAHQRLAPGGIFACAPEPNGGGLYKLCWRMARYFYKIFSIEYDWEVEKGTLNMVPRELERSLRKAGFDYAQVLPFQVMPHFHLKFIADIDKKIIDSVKRNFSLYVIIEAEKKRYDSLSLSRARSKHSPHNIIPRLIKKENPLILDVGCNNGLVGREIIHLKKATLDGIDINDDALEAAKKNYRKVYKRDLFQPVLGLDEEKYDYIIFSDILEHLPKPSLVLKDARKYLKDDGLVIISLPNVARLEIRAGLLLGNFDYKPGILSEEHIRFYTRRSAQEMIEESGYRVLRAVPTGLGHMVGFLPNLTAFQFIYICRKTK